MPKGFPKSGVNAGWIKKGSIPSNAFKKGQEAWNKGKKLLEQTGNKHHAWKGDGVSYRNLHRWVERNLGKASYCDECGLSEIPKGKKRYFHWSNWKGTYERNLTDWIALCYKCHFRLDWAMKRNTASELGAQ